MSRLVKLCIFLAVVLIGLVFHLRNSQPVIVNYYLGQFELPFSAIVVIALSLGVALGYIVGLPAQLKVKRENARLKREIVVSAKELDALRVIPVKDDI